MNVSEDWKMQASFKFGPNGSAMLNMRTATLEELENACRNLPNVVGSLVVAAEMLVAESAQTGRAAGVVGQSFAGTQVVDSQSNAAPAPVAAPAGSPYPPCGPNGSHGPRLEKSGFKNNRKWVGHFCAQRKCEPIFEDN